MKEVIPEESIILHPTKNVLMYWNSYFQKYYTDDYSMSLTLEEYNEF